MLSFIYFIGIFFLIWFSYLDVKTSMVSNKLILAMFLVGLGISVYLNQFFIMLIPMGCMFGLGYVLWHFNALGGADAKLLCCLPYFFGLFGFPRNMVGLFIFLIIFMIVGSGYGVLAKFMKTKKKIPFVPVITLSYNIFWLWTLFWK